MKMIDAWFEIFESSGLLKDLVESIFHYLPESLRARMPHYIAIYMIISAVCLILSILIRKSRHQEGGDAILAAGITAIGLSITLVLVAVALGDPIRNVITAFRYFGPLFQKIGTHIISFRIFSLLYDLLDLAANILSILLFGGITLLPLLSFWFVYTTEHHIFGPYTPVAIVGHSVFIIFVILAVIAGLAVFAIFAFPIILVIIVIRNWWIIP